MFTRSAQKNTKKQGAKAQGFTLVELMVSLTIFSIVMMVSTGTLLVLIDVNAKAQALYSATSNLSFALDSMTREMRTGYHYYCDESDGESTQELPPTIPSGVPTQDCTNLNTTRDFVTFSRERDNVRMGYRRNVVMGTDGILRGVIEQKLEGGNWMQITSRDVAIDVFDIVVNHSDTFNENNDTEQSTVDIRIVGHVNNGLDVDTDFNIQTRIVERRFDVI